MCSHMHEHLSYCSFIMNVVLFLPDHCHFSVRCRAFVSDTEFRAAERTLSLEIQVTVTGIDINIITVFAKKYLIFLEQCFMVQLAHFSESRRYCSTWYVQSQINRWDTL